VIAFIEGIEKFEDKENDKSVALVKKEKLRNKT
jgi:hypothetical protein